MHRRNSLSGNAALSASLSMPSSLLLELSNSGIPLPALPSPNPADPWHWLLDWMRRRLPAA